MGVLDRARVGICGWRVQWLVRDRWGGDALYVLGGDGTVLGRAQVVVHLLLLLLSTASAEGHIFQNDTFVASFFFHMKEGRQFPQLEPQERVLPTSHTDNTPTHLGSPWTLQKKIYWTPSVLKQQHRTVFPCT